MIIHSIFSVIAPVISRGNFRINFRPRPCTSE